MVDYRLLSLLKIVETGSFSKAANQLGGGILESKNL